jgi:hypothetical protein
MGLFSAYRDFKKQRQLDAQRHARDMQVKRLHEGIDTGNKGLRGAAMCDLCKYADMPDMPSITKFIVDKIEVREGLSEAISASIYMMNAMQNNAVQSTLAENMLRLASRVDRRDENEMAGVAMAADLIAYNAAEGSQLRQRGIELWRDAVDGLSKTRTGIKYAFGAASNAALGSRNGHGFEPHPLRAEAIESWYNNVMDLSKTNPVAAKEEATRIAENYNDAHWAPVAPPFTAKAREALQKFSAGK